MGDRGMSKNQALKELSDLQQTWRRRQLNAEQDGTSDFMMLEGAISGLDVAIDIVKEIK
jgi:hypothetical protein